MASAWATASTATADVEAPDDPPRRRRLTPTGALLASYAGNPLGFVERICGDRPLGWQVDALRDYGRGDQKTCIAGCTGSGKDRFLAWIIWHTLATRFFSRVLCTSASGAVLATNLWTELATVRAGSPILGSMFDQLSRQIRARGPAGERWFAVARTSPARYSKGGGEAQAEGVAGFYADDTLTVIDEMSGVHDAVIDALSGSANTARRRIVGVGNPLRSSGRMFDIFHRPAFRSEWTRRHVSYLDSPLTSGTPDLRAIRETWLAQFGLGSTYYRARALGQFPLNEAMDTATTHDVVATAQSRFLAALETDDPSLPLVVGIDCARFGDDETVWYFRRGRASLAMQTAGKTDGPTIGGRAILVAQSIFAGEFVPPGASKPVAAHPEFGRPGFDPRLCLEFRIDEGGLAGLGPVDFLRREGWSVAGVNNGSAASLPDRYRNLGTELWLEDLPRALVDCSLVPDELLAVQLAERQYRFTGKADQRIMRSKDELRSQGKGSPDRGDACVLAWGDREKLGTGVANLDEIIAFV